MAATANVLVGLLAIAYARRHPVAAAPEPEPAPAPEGAGKRARTAADRRAAADEAAGAGTAPLGVWLTVAALGVSGAVSLAYEVAWTRALSLVIGSSTYAFTSMLVASSSGSPAAARSIRGCGARAPRRRPRSPSSRSPSA